MQSGELAWLRAYAPQPWNLLKQWITARCLPCTHSRGELRHRFRLDMPSRAALCAKVTSRVDEYGWEIQFKEVTAEQRDYFTRITHGQYDPALADSQLARQSARALGDLLDLCRKEGIPVALVLMPEASYFRACYAPAVNAFLHDFLTGVQQHWHVPLIDARQWIEDKYFWDGHHLLPAGAAVFTDRFERNALRPLVKKVSGAFSAGIQLGNKKRSSPPPKRHLTPFFTGSR
jgi:hypothetical protein